MWLHLNETRIRDHIVLPNYHHKQVIEDTYMKLFDSPIIGGLDVEISHDAVFVLGK